MSVDSTVPPTELHLRRFEAAHHVRPVDEGLPGSAPQEIDADWGEFASRILILMPAYNEGRVIAGVIGDLRRLFPDVVVVDDGSTDDTAQQAQIAGAKVIRHVLNRGQGAALQTGIEYFLSSGAECVVTFDSDGQHRVDDVVPMVIQIKRGEADVVLGSRFLGRSEGMPLGRHVLLQVAVILTRALSGLHVTDTHNGLRAISRHAARVLAIRARRMAHASELLDQLGRANLRVSEAPVRVAYTQYSLSKGQANIAAFRIAWDYATSRLFS